MTPMCDSPPGLPSSAPHTFEALSTQLGRRAPVSSQIAESIRNMIVSGDLKPGDRIVESRIARQIGVGQPTVREALVALEHQGLVVRKANQGCVVTSLSASAVAKILTKIMSMGDANRPSFKGCGAAKAV